jgi:C4-dicarboxylate transporter DctM subunit
MEIELGLAAFLIFSSLIVLFAAGLPIAFAMGIVAFCWLFFLVGPHFAFDAVGLQMFSVPTNFVLLAAPLFILMAQIIIFTGLGTLLYESMDQILSGLPGSLALSSIGAGTVFAAATGNTQAACAAIGPIAVQEMNRRDYDRGLSTGSVTSVGGLAVIIPPSNLFIYYGFVTQTSVAKLFMAGILPGLLMALCMAAYVILRVKINPKAGPGMPALPFNKRISALIRIWPIAVLMILVLGCIYGGITTPTEAAGIGVVGSFLMAVFYKKLTWINLKEALVATTRITSFVFLIVISSMIFGFLMAYLGIPQSLTEWVIGTNLSPWMALLMVNILLIILGMVVDAVTMVMVVIPLIMPTLNGLGFDPIWLGVVLGINIELAMLTPPVGINLYVMTGVVKPFGISFGDVVRGTMPFIGAQIIAWLLVIFIPDIALWLPSRL